MSILQKLTLRHLRLNLRRTVITIIGIVLSVAMVTAVSGMVVSFQDLLYRDSIAMEGLWHVRYRNVPEDVAAQVVSEPVFSGWELIQMEEGVELSLLFSRLHKGIFDESEAVCQKYGIEMEQVRYHNNLLIAKGIVPGDYYTALYTFAGILLGLIAVGSVLVISNSFAISTDQRSRQFGLLKSTGATGPQIRGMVLFEGVVLAAVAIPLGLAAGVFIQWVALTIANGVLDSMIVNVSVPFRIITSPMALLTAVLAALITVFFAAWVPARRAAKASAIEAIRQTGSIRLSRRNVRVSPLTGKLFGFEGILAAKTMGRNRGKYRATILALVVSIVLFIGVSSFADILIKATSMMYEDIGTNVLVTLHGDTARRQDLVAEMESWGAGMFYPSQDITGEVLLPEGTLTEAYRNYFPGESPPLRLYGIGSREYEALCSRLRIDPGAAGNEGRVSAIAINTSGTYIRQGRRINFIPYHLRVGDRFPASVNGNDWELEIAGIIQDIPPSVRIRFGANLLNVIVPDEVLARYQQENGATEILWLAVQADDPAGFTAQVEDLLEEALPFHTWSALDYDQMMANNRNIGLLVMLFVYGFIAMLTLIGVTSVITTISTSIALRTREFAMLRSAGMTEAAMGKMLGFESLLYGIKALVWGIPLGLLTCFLLYKAMTSVMDFPFLWPVDSILISAAAIFLITFATMAFARRRQRRYNIAESLRDDVI